MKNLTNTLTNKILHQNGQEEVHEMYAVKLFSSLGKGVVSIFLPILLLGIGYELEQVAIYFIVFYALKFMIHRYIGYRIISRFGIKKSLSFSLLLEALGYVVVAVSGYGLTLGILALSLLLLPLAETLHGDSMHLDLLEFMGQKHESVQVGFMYMLVHVGAIGGPLIAGFSAEIFGPIAALWIGAVLLAFSGTPLFFTQDVRPPIIQKEESVRIGLRHGLANFATNFDASTGMFIWPIFIYILFGGDFSTTGIFFSAGFMVSAVGVVVLAKASDRKDDHKDKVMVSMSFMRSLTHTFRILTTNTPLAIFTNTFGEFGSMQKPSSFTVRFYDYGRRSGDHLSYIRSMEQVADLGKMTPWAIFLVAIFFAESIAFQLVFAAAATVSLLMLLMRDN